MRVKVLTVTKVDRLYYEEMRKAVEENTAQVSGTVTYTIATNMLESGDSIEKVSKTQVCPSTMSESCMTLSI